LSADDALGEKLSTLCFEGPLEALTLTSNTQPALLAVSVAAHAVFSKRGPPPDFVAGHSLGEYSALVASRALPFDAAVRSVRARGRFMQEAVPAGVGAMAAVLGLSPEKIRAVCEQVAGDEVLTPANYNAPEQTVIAGHALAVERALPQLKLAGAKRVVRLAVSAPFHCALMDPVKRRLAEVLSGVHFSPPKFPVVTNVEAVPNSNPERMATLLVDQVSAPVRWVECVQELARQGVTRIVELGSGKVLCGLVRRICPEIECLHVDDPESLEKALA
jgi:[acyl-carrier-protein] S-malonyltransferase